MSSETGGPGGNQAGPDDLFRCAGSKSVTLEKLIYDTQAAFASCESGGTEEGRPGLKISTLEKLIQEAQTELEATRASEAGTTE